MKRIGLLGGLFDPVHNGHIRIAESFLESSQIDELWILPSSSPAHKDAESVTPFGHRLRLLQLVFKDFNTVLISDLEEQLPKPGYSLNTLRFLEREYPADTFFWCLGSDHLKTFNTWFKYEEILSRWRLLVAERPGYMSEGIDSNIMDRCIMVSHKPKEVSSTEVRKQLKTERKSNLIPPEALEYILQNDLYL